MRIAFYVSERKPREIDLAQTFKKGCPHQVDLVWNNVFVPGYDLACVIGVKAMRLIKQLDCPYLYWDKGYNRDWPKWWRWTYNSHQPVDLVLARDYPGDRAAAQGWKFPGWKSGGKTVLYCGASETGHKFFGLPHPTEFAAGLVASIRRHTARPIVYRPKPSWKEAQPVAGAEFDRGGRLEKQLARAHVVVTYGSAVVLESLLAGVPSIVLGNAPTRAICSTDIGDIERPLMAQAEECQRLLNGLAYFQWNRDEIWDGTAWRSIDSVMQSTISAHT